MDEITDPAAKAWFDEWLTSKRRMPPEGPLTPSRKPGYGPRGGRGIGARGQQALEGGESRRCTKTSKPHLGESLMVGTFNGGQTMRAKQRQPTP